MSKEVKAKTGAMSILKDAMILFIITLISGISLGFVYEITLPAIEAQKAAAIIEAYKAVYPEAASFIEDADLTAKAAEAVDTVLVPNGLEGITIDQAYRAVDASNKDIGYVMTITTQNGYGSGITISLGYTADGTVTGMEILSISETAGMGMKATEPEFKGQFAGKKVDQFEVTKNGASADNQINAISGATITSNAVTGAVNAGIRFITDSVVAGK